MNVSEGSLIVVLDISAAVVRGRLRRLQPRRRPRPAAGCGARRCAGATRCRQQRQLAAGPAGRSRCRISAYNNIPVIEVAVKVGDRDSAEEQSLVTLEIRTRRPWTCRALAAGVVKEVKVKVGVTRVSGRFGDRGGGSRRRRSRCAAPAPAAKQASTEPSDAPATAIARTGGLLGAQRKRADSGRRGRHTSRFLLHACAVQCCVSSRANFGVDDVTRKCRARVRRAVSRKPT